MQSVKKYQHRVRRWGERKIQGRRRGEFGVFLTFSSVLGQTCHTLYVLPTLSLTWPNSSTILEFSITVTRAKDWHALRKRLQSRRVSIYKQLPRSLTITIHVMPGMTGKLHKKQVNKKTFWRWRCGTYSQYSHWRFNVGWPAANKKSRRIKQSQCMFPCFVISLILLLLLLTPTIWFSLDPKWNVSDRVVSGIGKLFSLDNTLYASDYDSDYNSAASENQP